ncbi:unnamed protein product, partial [Medioppia subpectinata]
MGRYLIDYGDAALVDAALLISVCWDLLAGAESLEKPGLNFKLNQHLTRSLCGIISENRDIFSTLPKVNVDDVLLSKNLREFDSNFTVKMWGFKSVKDYYSQSSHKGKLCCIKRPTLCVNAADDMFAPVCGYYGNTLPVDEVEESSHVAMIVTSRGGHIGFMEGINTEWVNSCLRIINSDKLRSFPVLVINGVISSVAVNSSTRSTIAATLSHSFGSTFGSLFVSFK